ncbi:polyphenol oxidase family protein [Demequina sp. NBRC 110052]|uniref:polyphenol oxidase family protein n=1 Tax=Demequina sp. NBRC 110052 TaxID=1570341 RepID=UPI0009FC0193|nr:polyphenol oxidase family protein [Demequina sp. NBRC 110052]
MGSGETIDAGLPVTAFFTTRHGGVSVGPYGALNLATHVGDTPDAVARNRDLVAERAGAPITFLTAEHGIAVARLTEPLDRAPAADVLVTDTPGVALAAIAADCVPLLLHDSATGAVAAAHVGREGLYLGAVDSAVAALLDLRAAGVSGEISAAIGPAICGACYEVPLEMRERVAERHPAARASTRAGTPSLDLPRATETRLAELGAAQIARQRACTLETPDLFSHRRDGVTGRHAGVIVCEAR